MQYLSLLFTLALLAANLWGMMLAAGLFWRNRWFALPAGPVLVVTAAYAVECHHGLGPSLAGLGLIGTGVSACLIAFSLSSREPARLGERGRALLRDWRAEFTPRRAAAPLGVLAAIFLYALAWRFLYPNIDGSSEKIADFSYLCSYQSGATIPVPDAWLYPFLSTQYYSFQYYGAALMGRLLSIPPGTTYNLAYCLLIGLSGAAFAGTVALIARKTWVRALVFAVFVLGGTGVSGLVHLTDTHVEPWTSMRYIGSAPRDRPPLGPWIKRYESRFALADGPMELPGEPFAYSIYLGDYHPPLSGYYLMGVAAMAMILWSRLRQRRYAAFLGCTLTWALLANTWDLPLQGLAVLAWLAFNWRDWRQLVPAVAAGAAAVWLLAWVYLSAFTSTAESYQAALRLVPWKEHTPPLELAIFFLPTLALVVLGAVSGVSAARRLALMGFVFVIFSEFFFVDDVYSGKFDRFNTTLKWWPWIMAGTAMTLAPIVLEQARRRWVQVIGAFFCAYPCLFVADLWRPMHDGPKDAAGRIEGHYFLTKDLFPRLMLDRMKVEKPGVAIERPDKEGAFVNSACLPLFAGQRMWLGWFGHELLWRGYSEDIRGRHDQLLALYEGRMPDAGRWLLAQGIDYVLWYRLDHGDTPQMWQKVNGEVGPEYVWCDILTYQNEDGRRVGFWRRASPAAP